MRRFRWAPGRIEFFTLQGHHDPTDFPLDSVIHHWVYAENGSDRIVPEPGRENLRFNLWLNQDSLSGAGTSEVVVNDFSYTPLGDFDLDGDYDCSDIDALIAEVVAGTNSAAWDLTGDGIVDGLDISAWLAEAGSVELGFGLSFLPGDANLDGVVDVADFNAWSSHRFTASPSWCSGDFDADGFVDVADFNIWNSNKFTGPASTITMVPEPWMPGWLVLLAISVWCLRRR